LNYKYPKNIYFIASNNSYFDTNVLTFKFGNIFRGPKILAYGFNIFNPKGVANHFVNLIFFYEI